MDYFQTELMRLAIIEYASEYLPELEAMEADTVKAIGHRCGEISKETPLWLGPALSQRFDVSGFGSLTPFAVIALQAACLEVLSQRNCPGGGFSDLGSGLICEAIREAKARAKH